MKNIVVEEEYLNIGHDYGWILKFQFSTVNSALLSATSTEQNTLMNNYTTKMSLGSDTEFSGGFPAEI